MKNIKLIIEYDGTNYHGWQAQKNASSVQQTIEDTIRNCTGEQCTLIGAGRTDVGVHALGQVANFATDSTIPGSKFSYVLNSFLPDDIVIKESTEVDRNFHARFSAIGKKYRYLIYNAVQPSALLRNRAFHVNRELDVLKMQYAAKYFLGTHDFSAFCASGASVKTFTRTIEEISILKNHNQIEIKVSGDGFLYNMVRIIAGTLVEVGLRKFDYRYIEDIINSRDRRKAGRTAPSCGLYMVEVYYQ